VTRIDGVAHLRIKECDRLAVLSSELAKLGASVEVSDDSLIVAPRSLRGGATLDPQGDHRMAMAFALVGLRVPDVEIADRRCVAKSFSSFWSVLEQIR
jgi:3-phosphoshikimate 1-carboxyvinyltransferase